MIKYTNLKKLSPRLETVLHCLGNNVRMLADIGTDHAFLPIAAVQRGLTARALACDLNSGPLQTAADNIRDYGMADRIETRLGFGLRSLAPGEADGVVITGMGGMRILDILRDRPEVTATIPRLILGPQHDLQAVCDALPGLGFVLTAQQFVQEKHKHYHVLMAQAVGL